MHHSSDKPMLVRGVSFRSKPCLGCSVTHHTSSSSMNFSLLTPSGSSNLKRANNTARMVRASVRAKLCPMQLRGPDENVLKEAAMLRRLPCGVASGCSAQHKSYGDTRDHQLWSLAFPVFSCLSLPLYSECLSRNPSTYNT